MGSGRNGETPGRIGAGWWLALFLLLGAALPVFCEDGGVDAPGLDVDGLPVGWYAVIDTSLGRILARLLPEQAPQAVAHFAALAEGRLEWNDPFTGKPRRDPYYDGVVIHRVAAGQRFEAGDPTGTSRGGGSCSPRRSRCSAWRAGCGTWRRSGPWIGWSAAMWDMERRKSR